MKQTLVVFKGKTAELVEAEVIDYFTVDPRTGNPRNWGFARLADATSIFFHANSWKRMSAQEVGRTQFIPRFTNYMAEETFVEPKKTDKIIGIIAGDRHDRRCLIVWSDERCYEKALKDCEQREQERLNRTNQYATTGRAVPPVLRRT